MSNIEKLLSGEEKLEFGNQEQIECIDSFQRVQEEAEEGLQRYRVTLWYSGSVFVDVEAHDEQEALEVAREEADFSEIEWEDEEHYEVELLKEAEK